MSGKLFCIAVEVIAFLIGLVLCLFFGWPWWTVLLAMIAPPVIVVILALLFFSSTSANGGNPFQ